MLFVETDCGLFTVHRAAVMPHCTDTVTPFWLEFPPTDTRIGSSPDAPLAGICTLSCIIPATNPGASPAYT